MIELTEEQNYVCDEVLKNYKKKKVLTISGYAGTGKAQPIYETVYTPFGPVKIGDLKIGDSVCTTDGTIAQVDGVFPQGEMDIYAVGFDGSHVVHSTLNHLWKVFDRQRRRDRIVTLEEIKSTIVWRPRRNRYAVDVPKGLHFREVSVPIDPYLLGLLIGDGSISGYPKFTSNDEQLLNSAQALVSEHGLHLVHSQRYDWRIVCSTGGRPENKLKTLLHSLGYKGVRSCDKFVPECYKQNSLDVRLAVIRGLMDTDGTVDHRFGTPSFSTVSAKLASDFKWLIESCGGLSNIRPCVKWFTNTKGEKVSRNAFNVSVQLPKAKDLFLLERKKSLVSRKDKVRRAITSIEFVGKHESVCISVTSHDKMYITSGFVPTHNTTIVKQLKNNLSNFAVCSYTGKSASILRKKGIEDASTIHSLIYVIETDEFGNPVLDSSGSPNFILNPELDCSGVIIDEASMVSWEIYQDLASFGVPLIFVGDHGQLPPIGRDFNLMEKTDYKLEKIHRNAGEIAFFAEFIRLGYKPSAYEFRHPKKITFIDRHNLSKTIRGLDINWHREGQIVCAYNATRVKINDECREALGFQGPHPSAEEKVMCLRNNSRRGLFNGMQGTVKKVMNRNQMLFNSNNSDFDVFYDPNVFGQEKYEFSQDRDDPDPFDFAYCTTVHKAQGDEFEHVLVVEQKCNSWEHARWAYTAASRAKSDIIWCRA